MATPANPLQKPPATQPTPSTMDLMLGGLPAAQGSGQAQTALAQMLGPQQNVSAFLPMGGPQYADELDQLEWNPMSSWY